MSKGLDARVAEIASLYADGRSMREIARAHDVTTASISRLLRRHGIKARRRGRDRAENPGYVALHRRVYALRGQPSRCERCGLDDPTRRYQWANLTGNYADPDDYERMCVPCHKRYDNARRKAAA